VVAGNDFLTASQAAVLIGISRSTVRRAVAHGQLLAWHTPGKHLRVARDNCLEFARALGRVDLTGRPYDDASPATPAGTAVGESGSILQ
jgi:excisionase family DNA binding protein